MKVSLTEMMVTTYPKGFEGWRMFRIEYGGHAEVCLMECVIWLPPNSDRKEIEDLFSKWQPEDQIDSQVEVSDIEIVKKKLVRNAARCKLCGDVVESRYRHDFVMCSCEAMFVDGGLDYIRIGGNLDELEDLSEWEDIE